MSSSPSSSSPAPEKPKRKREDALDSDLGSSSSQDESDTPDTPVKEEDDLPVLSHAAKRKQKKKEQKLQDQGDNASGVPKKKRKLKDGTAVPVNDKTVKRQNSVWVGNMSFKATEENIRAFFKDKGAGEVTRINMPTKAAKGPGARTENRGFAYVDFETLDAKKAAIALSEQHLLGRKLLIKDGDDFTGRPDQPTAETTMTVNGVKKSLSKSAQKILRNQKQPPAPTLFFGNLSFDTTEDSIRELLESHREKRKQRGKSKEENTEEGNEKAEPWIRKVRLGTFEDSGKCKGFAFVDFKITEFATSALINPRNHHLNGRDLVVEYASAEAVRRGASKGSRSNENTVTSADCAGRKPKVKKDAPPHKTRVDKQDSLMQVDAPEENDHQTGRKSNQVVARTYRGDKGRSKGRPRPGAALALAKRESAAIVPSQGQKISFET